MPTQTIHSGKGKEGLIKENLRLDLDAGKFKAGKAKLVLVAKRDGKEIARRDIDVIIDAEIQSEISRRGFLKKLEMLGLGGAGTVGAGSVLAYKKFKTNFQNTKPPNEKEPQIPEEAYSNRGLEQTLTVAQEKVLSEYVSQFRIEEQDPNIINRTFENRLEDHEVLLTCIINPNDSLSGFSSLTKKDREYVSSIKNKLAAYKQELFPQGVAQVFFIDIGPGIANKDLTILGGRGKPAITTQEIAVRFPYFVVAALDLPEEMERFTGTTPDKSYLIDEDKRKELLAKRNIHLVSGDGLKSLLLQWQDSSTNPYPERTRPKISHNATIIIRSANSIDIYCEWKEVFPAIDRIAHDFKDHPVMLLFNREILIKTEGEIDWMIIGKTPKMGFEHNIRKLDRNGEPPFVLYEKPVCKPDTLNNLKVKYTGFSSDYEYDPSSETM